MNLPEQRQQQPFSPEPSESNNGRGQSPRFAAVSNHSNQTVDLIDADRDHNQMEENEIAEIQPI
jgi:hypothetical protein